MIEKSLGNNTGVLYLQYFVYMLYIKGIDEIDRQNLPASVNKLLKNDFSRAIGFAKKSDNKFMSLNNRTFLGYIEKLCFRSFPIGSQDIAISGIPRSLAIKQGILDALEFSCLLSRVGGHYPFFEMHYNPHRFRHFNQSGWDDLLCHAAEMLSIQKNVNGLFGSAWFFDPALKEISPEIFYIYQTLERASTSFFFFRATDKDKKNAFLTSKIRRETHKEGRYTPASYTMILPKDTLLAYHNLN